MQLKWSDHVNAPYSSTDNLQLTYGNNVFFFWVMPPRLNFMCWHFRTLCLFHLHRLYSHDLWRWNSQSAPKHWHTKFRCQGITQKKEYNIHNMAKAWNQDGNRLLMCQKLNIKTNELILKIKYQCHFHPLYLRYPNKYYVMKNAIAHE